MRGIAVDGKLVKDLRRKLGLTQERLATRADCDVRTIRNAERGQNVDAITLKCLATALDVAVSRLAKTAIQDRRRASTPDCIQLWRKAFFAADIETLLEVYSQDAIMQLPSAPLLRGHVQLKEAFRHAFETFVFEDTSDPRITVDGDRVILESGLVRITSRNNNHVVHSSAVHLFQLEESLISEHIAFYDTLPFAESP